MGRSLEHCQEPRRARLGLALHCPYHGLPLPGDKVRDAPKRSYRPHALRPPPNANPRPPPLDSDLAGVPVLGPFLRPRILEISGTF